MGNDQTPQNVLAFVQIPPTNAITTMRIGRLILKAQRVYKKKQRLAITTNVVDRNEPITCREKRASRTKGAKTAA